MDFHWPTYMEKIQDIACLPVSPVARYDSDRRTVIVQFPQGMIISRGSARLYRSTVEDLGLVLPIEPTLNGLVEIPIEDLPGGQWHLELKWQVTAKKFFYAIDLYLNEA